MSEDRSTYAAIAAFSMLLRMSTGFERPSVDSSGRYTHSGSNNVALMVLRGGMPIIDIIVLSFYQQIVRVEKRRHGSIIVNHSRQSCPTLLVKSVKVTAIDSFGGMAPSLGCRYLMKGAEPTGAENISSYTRLCDIPDLSQCVCGT